jgi:hypothetical protein
VTLRHLTIGSSLIAALLLATITRAESLAPATSPTDQNEVASLRQRVAELSAKNTALEAQITKLKQQLRSQGLPWNGWPDFSPSNSPVPLKPVPSTIPPSAVPHLFNGGTYYTIPVDGQLR